MSRKRSRAKRAIKRQRYDAVVEENLGRADRISEARVEYVASSLEMMGRYERDYYDQYIEPALRKGDIVDWRYEPITFRLGYRCSYTPDFLTLTPSGRLSIIEVKGGFVREDAMVKLKTFASMFPWLPVYIAQKRGPKASWDIIRVKTR